MSFREPISEVHSDVAGSHPDSATLKRAGMHRWRNSLIATVAIAATVTVTLAGCTADPSAANSTPSGQSTAIPTQQVDQALHDRLPARIRDAGKIVAVNTGSFPPYTIITGTGAQAVPDGVLADLSKAVGDMLGVKIEHATVDGLATALTGMQAGHYDLELDPTGDYPDRHKQATFIDYVHEHVVFAGQKGNPKQINDLTSTCGDRIAVQAASSAEKVIKGQSDKCTAAGKPAVEVQSYKDSPSAILAVQSGRADAFFSSQAPLTYYVQQSGGKLELAGVGKDNGFGNIYQGAMVPAGSPLADVVLAAFQKLFANGTYDAIMAKWGLDANKLPQPGVNLGGQ